MLVFEIVRRSSKIVSAVFWSVRDLFVSVTHELSDVSSSFGVMSSVSVDTRNKSELAKPGSVNVRNKYVRELWLLEQDLDLVRTLVKSS